MKKWRENTAVGQTWIVFNFFVDKYQDLKLPQKLSAEITGYHSVNNVALNGEIDSVLDNLENHATTDQSYAYQLMETICQLTETTNILRE